MTNNHAWTGQTKSDEGWSEWIDWEGGECPVMPETAVQWKGRRVNKNGIDGSIGAEMLYWEHLGQDMDITAYRYRLDDNAMTPESDMHPDLEWLSRNVSEWPKGYGAICRAGNGFMKCDFALDDEEFTEAQWLQARKDLGLDKFITPEEERTYSEIEPMTPEEEEIPAEEWRAEKPDNVNKPKHYQLREGYEVYDLRQDLASKASAGGATYDQYSDWDRAIEYIIRMWGKNRLEDAKKGRWYLDKLISKLEAE